METKAEMIKVSIIRLGSSVCIIMVFDSDSIYFRLPPCIAKICAILMKMLSVSV